jgi:cell wall-associated NlpC family hydrolase
MSVALRLAWLLFPKWFAALVLLIGAVLVVMLVLLLAALNAQLRRPPLPPLPAPVDQVAIATTMSIPLDQLVVIIQTAQHSPCGMSWNLLASVAKQESDFGRNMATSSAGAIGYGQFLPATWAQYGQGGNPYAYQDALPAMARYLCALGVARDPWLALTLYSGCDPRQPGCRRTDGYADTVLARASQYAAASVSPNLGQHLADLFNVGAQWLGFPYRLGGNGLSRTDGIDCSALVQKVYTAIGIVLPRTAQQQYDAVAKVQAKDAHPGDLLFFTNTYDSADFITHVGIYEGIVDGAPRMLDASGSAVRFDNPFAGYWKQHLVSAGRP